MTKRKAISKKTRFEVFKRDSFTCQYCGEKAPDVILHVDHIDPVAKGGGNEIVNLITSCADCNGGKGARELDDTTTLAKQRQQIIELNERREQLELMLKWREGLKDVDNMALDAAIKYFSEVFDGWSIQTDAAAEKLRKLVKDFGLQTVMDGMDAGFDSYCAAGIDNDSVIQAFSKLGGICHNLKNPDERGIRYARGILRNRLNYVHEGIAISLLREARAAGADDEELKEMAASGRNWRSWQDDMHALIQELEG